MNNFDNTAIWNTIEGNWHQFKGKIQEKWGRLTDDELDQTQGQREQLTGLIQERYGTTQAEINKQIDELAARLKV